MRRYDQISAFVLSGGASSRMGREKSFLEFGGEPLIARTARVIEPLVVSITIVGSPQRYTALGLRAIADRKFASGDEAGEARGPLVGIATALTASETPWNLILACDLPYLTATWLDWLLGRAASSGEEVILPRTSGGVEPLAAVYRRECAAPIIASLGRGVRRVSDALDQFRVTVVPESDWRHIDPEGRVLRNMNAPADYEEAREWLKKH